MSRKHFPPHARATSTRKRLSQNFLVDPRAAQTVVRAAGVAAGDLVLEIGAGDGMLTRQLLAKGYRVIAYEKDRHYSRRLHARYAGDPRIRVIHNDFRRAHAPGQPFAVVANIPFGISTDILRWCLDARHLTSATLLTQREFARKHCGDYDRWTKLTVTHWPASTSRLGPRIGRTCFDPVPRVDAAVLRLARRPRPLLAGRETADYRALVELGFSGVGGSLSASLRREFPAPRVNAACVAAGIEPDAPVGLVHPDRWITLYRQLRRIPAPVR
ncbi:23S ribosomal RNA methyltransferase Erm [Nocardia cyriacigeorgica]|uniref:rRNA methyltransferase (Carbomycin-resistance protein) n=1 Tax=Nocardia cyriacigeorgica (strain GUH-2) TaxID=1127134 RepID=H6RDA2_NOCCG|nr:23S ribosomal RNA methyltransferase Erm [Nocardia cyriacigeorgica]MBF6287594.1 23S ribosomal RNA methyltransferase Erm [Nocardia cyriacigeorgica]BDT87603.1 23S rRNA (adenine(2058)-N(6))-methyltransferase Erm(O) [Nocardia cyriacigeorgica]CCF63950.1 rRNA methyltransferase (Carbomycin-resistance protein) [Nocardia cyriacigeorgica GUH-2]